MAGVLGKPKQRSVFGGWGYSGLFGVLGGVLGGGFGGLIGRVGGRVSGFLSRMNADWGLGGCWGSHRRSFAFIGDEYREASGWGNGGDGLFRT